MRTSLSGSFRIVIVIAVFLRKTVLWFGCMCFLKNVT